MERNVLSKNSPKYIDKHRLGELRHFCLQYDLFRKEYAALYNKGVSASVISLSRQPISNDSKAEKLAMRLALLDEKMLLITKTAHDVCSDFPALAEYLITDVTEGYGWKKLKARYNVPCGRDEYYKRKWDFYLLLNLRKD